jgi:hypothetical protein
MFVREIEKVELDEQVRIGGEWIGFALLRSII